MCLCQAISLCSLMYSVRCQILIAHSCWLRMRTEKGNEAESADMDQGCPPSLQDRGTHCFGHLDLLLLGRLLQRPNLYPFASAAQSGRILWRLRLPNLSEPPGTCQPPCHRVSGSLVNSLRRGNLTDGQ